MTRKRLLVVFTAAAILLNGGGAGAQATPANSYSATITWSSTSYSPSNFAGKHLATNGSSIVLSAIVLNNGKVADVSQSPILWYLDQDFLDGGIGQQQASFKVTQTAGGSHFVNVRIQLPDQTVSAAENIPIVSYKAVIDAPYPSNTVANNSTINLSLIPYFFNISSFGDLSFSWDINGTQQTASNSDNILSLNIGNQPSGQGIGIKGSIQNNRNQYEAVSSNTTLSVQ